MSINFDTTATGNVTLKAPVTSTSVTLILPTSAGSSGQVLRTDGIGNLSWSAASVPRAVSTTTNTVLSWTSDSTDVYSVTALETNMTISTDSGTPYDGQRMTFKFTTGNFPYQAPILTFTSTGAKCFRFIGVTLPAALTLGNTLYVGTIYNQPSNTWDIIAVREGPN